MLEIIDNKHAICKYCNENALQKIGCMTRVGGIKVQRYRCTNCGKSFY